MPNKFDDPEANSFETNPEIIKNLEEFSITNINAKPLLNNLPPNLRLKILNPPSGEPEKSKNYAYVMKSLISQEFEDSEIELLIKSFPIGSNRSNISKDIKRFRESDPGEDKIALKFAEEYENKYKFCKSFDSWYKYNGNYWEADEKEEIFESIRLVVRDTEMPNYKKRFATVKGIESTLRTDPIFSTSPKEWDQNIWYLATPNGTIDLKTGKFRISYPQDLITKSTSVAPEKGTPNLWLKFLEEATLNDQELIDYLQIICGYCLTGSIKEESLFFLHGEGGNGKGVFIGTLTNILGDYACVSPMEAFVENKFSNSHPTELAMLRGSRLVTAQETQEGKSWNEARIKTLTGGDKISARFMHENFFTFDPNFKLMISGNHEPKLRSVDEAIKRRFNKLPFIHKPLNPDLELKEKLKLEYPQILNWMIEGCLKWQNLGLNPPQIVTDSTKEYFSDQDLQQQWLSENCDEDPKYKETTEKLLNSWFKFASDNHQVQGDDKKLKSFLVRKGFKSSNHIPIKVFQNNMKIEKQVRGFIGLKLKTSKPENEIDNETELSGKEKALKALKNLGGGKN